VIYSRDLGRFRGLPFYVTGFAFIEDPHRDTPGDINVLIDAVTAALRFHDHEPTAASASEGH
jgi:hypothetical protein